MVPFTLMTALLARLVGQYFESPLRQLQTCIMQMQKLQIASMKSVCDHEFYDVSDRMPHVLSSYHAKANESSSCSDEHESKNVGQRTCPDLDNRLETCSDMAES